MSVFSRGLNTMSIPLELNTLNRKRLLSKLNKIDGLNNKISAVILQGGEYETRCCSDHEPLFRQESYFHWAFGVGESDFYGEILVPSGKTILFFTKITT